MTSGELVVANRAGIHARPATQIVKTAGRYASQVFLEKDSMKINAKSVMGIITLGATYKTKLLCVCEGPDEEEALEAMRTLFENRFED